MPHLHRDQIRSVLESEYTRTVDRGRLPVVERELTRLTREDIKGAVVELGCYRGAMTTWVRAVLTALGDERAVHTYDSFQGLPRGGEKDNAAVPAGEFTAGPEDVTALHDRFGLRRPTVHPGWFADTLPGRLPDTIAFVYLDGDMYDSILTGLTHCVPRLAPGAVVLVDDYADPTVPLDQPTVAKPKYPGVLKACQDYFAAAPYPVTCAAESCELGIYRQPQPAAV
ncbi:TylF/MycF/NovP-related O-methyltransferase [Streptomyces sp. NPDC096339]|uniref:TylF/MycF/NovP-related O-methyltransferase n=1 Tax=Streptomyces sp. NPDC096339 TaxID=3366086 RepID=UPI003820EBFF